MINLCECIMFHPTAQQLLNTLRNLDVCTNMQCFQTNEDAGFGIVQQQTQISDFYIVLSVMLLYILSNIPRSLLDINVTNKPSNIIELSDKN